MTRPPGRLRCLNGPPTLIAPEQWQAGFPMEDPIHGGFDVVAFCAKELQPSTRQLPSRYAIYAPMTDGPADEETLETAWKAADEVLEALEDGKQVLVTCASGLNRSGLVNALVLIKRYGVSGSQAVDTIQRLRRHALFNENFARYLRSL